MELADREEKSSDMNGMSSEQSENNENMDSYLQYGRYQAIRVWVLGSLLALTGAFSFGHNIFILTDPPDPWWCEDPHVIKCNMNVTG